MKRIISVFCAVVLCLLSVFVFASCNGKSNDYTKTVRTDAGYIVVTVSERNKDGKKFTDSESEEICKDVANTIAKEYLYYTKSPYLNEINGDVDAVLDCDSKYITALDRLIKIGESLDGAYTIFNGAYVSMLLENKKPAAEQIDEALSHTGEDKFTFGPNHIKKSDRAASLYLGSAYFGFAMEAGAQMLSSCGAEHGNVRFGSFMYVYGYEDEPLCVGIYGGDKTVGYIYVNEGYIASVESGYTYKADVNGEFDKVYVTCDNGVYCAALADAIYTVGKKETDRLYKADNVDFEAVMLKGNKAGLTEGIASVYTAETEEK